MVPFSVRARILLEVAESMKKEGRLLKRKHQNLANNAPDVPESSSRKKFKLLPSIDAEPETASSSGERKKGPIKIIKRLQPVERRPKKTVIVAGPSTPPDMPEAFRTEVRKLGDAQLKLILQKELRDSDVELQQSRLSIPLKQLGSDDFLNEEEKRMVRPGDGVTVTVVYKADASSEVRNKELRLRKWVYSSSSSYVLVHGWRDVFQASMLMKGDILQVWFFRNITWKPCFAIVKL